MVFSSQLSDDQLGQAIVVQCQRKVSSASDLTTEAEWLWSAEDNKVPSLCILSPKRSISAKWGGCVALSGHPQTEIPQELFDGWADRVSTEKHYNANERRFVTSESKTSGESRSQALSLAMRSQDNEDVDRSLSARSSSTSATISRSHINSRIKISTDAVEAFCNQAKQAEVVRAMPITLRQAQSRRHCPILLPVRRVGHPLAHGKILRTN
jgi:hypothetical protein